MKKSISIIVNNDLDINEVKLYTSQTNKGKYSYYIIQFGSKKARINLTKNIDKNERIELSLKLFNILNLSDENLVIKYEINDRKQTLILGPLIGIFIRKRRNNKSLSVLQKKVLEHYFNHAKQLNYVAYAFNADDINWQKKIIHGYLLINGKLTKKYMPFPNVMYDQNSSRTYEKLPNVKKSLEKLHNKVLHYFNPGYLDKWEIFNYITEHEIAKKYHPPTVLLENVNQVAKEVNKYKLVYLKPINGSQGRGIITVTKNKNVFEYKYQGNTLIAGSANNIARLEEFISNIVKKRKYIIQRGLPLVKYKGSPLDIRVLMQKNEKGNWIRTKMFARVSKPGSITSNLSLGGEAKTLDDTLTESFSASMIKNIKKKLIIASRIIPKALEEQSEKKFGELGLDLGITNNGEIWLIEINSKPWKAIETTEGSEELVEKSFRRPIEYAGYLAKDGYQKEV
ncbi:YheC/YheD family protein [Desulfuribacillus alkaliarsenatis]|uniref:ATP-grasp domain-containing protein n=1 Tax=Desulfuribacillus alkaliarsenatis TaxID=766136 RepID=A0A1E5FZL7_9FIRM|nr:YheC/YheD family protein [Desulfuribacillus alkaliarsenatis]OEF96012.1 hypothetical protein BHF68_09705 [Desulfuribacillus alkaliarsenatis]